MMGLIVGATIAFYIVMISFTFGFIDGLENDTFNDESDMVILSGIFWPLFWIVVFSVVIVKAIYNSGLWIGNKFT